MYCCLLFRIKRSGIDIFKTKQSYVGTEAIFTVKSIKLLQQAFQKRFIDISFTKRERLFIKN